MFPVDKSSWRLSNKGISHNVFKNTTTMRKTKYLWWWKVASDRNPISTSSIIFSKEKEVVIYSIRFPSCRGFSWGHAGLDESEFCL